LEFGLHTVEIHLGDDKNTRLFFFLKT
jgi:hypothetical protein